MKTLQGIPVSPGIAIAPAFVLRSLDSMPVRRTIAVSAVGAEIDRFKGAVEAARGELEKTAARSGLAQPVRSIAGSHREFLADPTLLGEIEDAITNGKCCAEWAVASVYRRWVEKFKALDDDFFRQRYVDLIDLERRVLHQLVPEETGERPTPESPAVLIAQDLTPTEAAGLDRRSVVGFATEHGGATSHTAIIAKSLGIPAVCGLGPPANEVPPGATVICDGQAGRLILDPDPETLARYEDLRVRHERRTRILKRIAELPAETLDGWPITVHGNIEFPFEVEEAIRNGADGIGLYRTEFIYSERNALPDEEAHLAAYREALEHLRGRPLTIRTFDFGADKFAEVLGVPREPNPFLGCRSIRYSFARPDLFRTQLRAVLRASAEGGIALMFPMISSVTELRRARTVLEQVKEELRADGQPFDAEMRVGVMVEIPSAAVSADLLAKEVDFFSIGTNDLTQYTLAVDRTNERVATLFRPSNPAILRMLSSVAREGERHRVRVSMCGEMAAERHYTLLLLGLGIREFSVAPSAVPEVKRVIRGVARRTAAEIARHALTLVTPEEVDAYLYDETDRLLKAIQPV